MRILLLLGGVGAVGLGILMFLRAFDHPFFQWGSATLGFVLFVIGQWLITISLFFPRFFRNFFKSEGNMK